MTRHEDMSRFDVCHVSGGDSCDSVTDADLLRLHSHIGRLQAGAEKSEGEKISPKVKVKVLYVFCLNRSCRLK